MIKGKLVKKLSAQIEARSHSFIVGEPEDVGGSNDGPTPVELIESALAACTILTLKMYAGRKEWDLSSVECEVNSKVEGKETHFTREITLQGALDQTQRERLLDIANKCPVHKLLSSQISIVTNLK